MNGVELTGTGLLLGLANGPACLLTCTPAVLPAFISRATAGAQKQFAWPILGRLLGGRLLAYLLVGLLAGMSGRSLATVSGILAPWMDLLLALFLFAHGAGLIQRFPCCSLPCGDRWRGSPFLMGLLTGFSLCPPFLMALTLVWAQGAGPGVAAIFFLAFFVGTSIYLLPLGFGGYLAQSQLFVRLAKVLALMAAVFFLLQCIKAAIS
nr:sulfite exporter TauE/SafE family protein [uncultured Desulfobulbus sp.]